MATIDWKQIPKFAELPVKPDAPAESSWGVFGDDDQIGCLNFLTDEGVLAAARLVRKGRVFRLDAPIGYSEPTLFGRSPIKHQIVDLFSAKLPALDDIVSNYNTQEGSQWDGLGHYGRMSDKVFYNNTRLEDVLSRDRKKLGIHHWAKKFVGRGVLLDVFSYCLEQGRGVDPLTRSVYSFEEIQAAAEAQKVELTPGTILLVRTGWMKSYQEASADQRNTMGTLTGVRGIGLEPSRRMVEWLWDNRVAALGTDCPSVEPCPIDLKRENLHHRALFLLGLPLGEQFDLEELAEDCRQDQVTEFMLVSTPLRLPGGMASPPNAVAIK
jgi:kynurenine formamidase